LVSENALRQQELATQAAEAEWEAARREAESAVQAAELMLEVAEKERRAAELQIEAAQQGTPLKSLRQKIEVLRQQIEAASLTSPVDGVVIAIDMSVGQPTSNLPVMRVADLTQMVCHAEVPVALLPRIAIGNEAAISGGGLGDESLSGRVSKVSRVAGAPRLPSPDPRQQVDYRSAEVVIEIDAEDAPRAAERIHAQVDVAIRAED
jgi:ABC exporter DevB family membrane fusion protein